MKRVRRATAVLAGVALFVQTLASSAGPAWAASSERELGREFLLQVRSQLPVLDDPATQRLVDRVGGRIVKALGSTEFDYRFFVVNHPALNAFAVPGGYVFVFTGLLAKTETEDELAGVLGHEIAHVNAHHISRMQQQGQIWNVAALLGMVLGILNPVLGAGAIAAAATAQLKFSREFEQEADFLGLKYMSRAGFDPHGMPEFFKEILIEQRLNPANVPAYMLSHPVTEERIANALTTIESQKLKVPPGKHGPTIDVAEARAVSKAVGGPAQVVIDEYQKAVDDKPDDAERQFLLGRVFQLVGQLDASRKALERARTLGGLDAHVDRALGSVYADLKMNPEAKTLLERALQRTPDDPTAHVDLGRVLEAQGDDRAALKEYQRAMTLAPDLDEAHRLAGLAFGRTGDQAEGFFHLAMASRLRGELGQALRHFRRTEELITESNPHWGEVEESIEELRPLVRNQEQEEIDRDRQRRRGTGLFDRRDIVRDRLEGRGPAPR